MVLVDIPWATESGHCFSTVLHPQKRYYQGDISINPTDQHADADSLGATVVAAAYDRPGC